MKKSDNKHIQILGIIPARGGSKRLPNKNIKLFLKKPLLYYTIKEAKKSKFISKIVVSTESKRISNVAKKLSVEVINRPKKLAKDNTTSLQVFQQVITYLEKNKIFFPDIIVILQPTSPLRTVLDIDNCIEKFISNKCDSVYSVSKVEHPPHWMYTIKRNQLHRIIIKGQENKLERHQIPEIYQLNGAVQITTKKNIMEKNSLMVEKLIPYIMPIERSIDIDINFEFKMAEIILKNKKLFK